MTPWRVVAERPVLSRLPYLTVTAHTIELPDGRVIDDYYQLQMPDFSSVYAETADGRILLLRSYRHGARRVCLGFPGGGIAAGEPPADGARRELLEETGYEADRWETLGSFIVNGNQRCCLAHFFKATGCRRVAEPHSGDLEDAELVLLTRDEAIDAMWAGELASLSQVALMALASQSDARGEPAG